MACQFHRVQYGLRDLVHSDWFEEALDQRRHQSLLLDLMKLERFSENFIARADQNHHR